MNWGTSILLSIVQFVVLSVCHAQKDWTINVVMGQYIMIPCGVQDRGTFERLVWKLGHYNSTELLAYLLEGSRSCNTRKKENCDLRSDGTLELPNVQETDSGDYFCVIGSDEKYYSQHTLVVHPKVAFETFPKSEDVFVAQTGPDEIVLAYTYPVCKNTDAIGTVTCDPPSGAKIGMNVTEIVCNCIHSDNVVDTCETSIPDVATFENCSRSGPESGSKAVGIVWAPVTAPGLFLGIFIGVVIGVTVTLIVIIALLKKKHNRKEPTHEESNPECSNLISTTVKSKKSKSSTQQTSRGQSEEQTKPEFTTHLQLHMTVIDGKRLKLKCFVNGYPNPTILWYKDGKQLDPQAGYKTTFSEGLAMLTAESTKEGDEGMFSCVAVNTTGDDITSCKVVVEKHTKPEFATHLQPDMTVIDGKPLKLECYVNGYPNPTIIWYKDDKQIDPQAGYKTTFSEGFAILTCESTKEGDEGMFSCKAVNPAGDNITSCKVVVERSKVMVQPSDDSGTLEGHSDVTDSGKPFTNPNESGYTAVDTPGTPNKSLCTEIREVHVDKILRVLPSRTDPAEGLVIRCMFNENFTVGVLGEDTETSCKAKRLTLKEAKFPLHISCLKCGGYCCSLKICGDEWSEDQEKDNCKDSCEDKESNLTNNVAPNLNLHIRNIHSL